MEKKVSIAIIDDDTALASNLKDILKAEDYYVEAVNDGGAGTALFHEKTFDFALVDIKLPDIPGPELVKKLSRVCPDTEYIMITGHATMETAIEAVRQKQVIGYENKPIDMEHLLTFIRQVIRRRRAEEALRASEKRFRAVMDQAADAFFIHNTEGRIVDVNRRACQSLGYTKEELLSMTIVDIDPEAIGKEKDKFWISVIEGETAVFESHHKRKDGDSFPVEITLGSIHLDQERLVLAIVRDSTERKRTEEEQKKIEDRLHRAQKMESLGLMAGGVAHDLNNILSGIVSYPELLLMDLPEDSPLKKPIKTIQESGMRAADVVEDLLTIARGVATGKEALNLNTLIAEYLASAEHQKLEKTHSFIDLRTELDPDLLNLSGSPTHIKKTLMNLVTNASEAIEGSGTVTISTANCYLDEPLKGYEEVRTGEYAMLTVSDDGSGISFQDLERIFEPFYTKKVMGRIGTGLGLAVVWNSVQDHDGYINVKSSEKGTVFELYFPTTREQVANEKEQVPLEDYLGQGEKILVVDDEERQREIASGILTRLGYNAETVSSGEEAIEYVKEHPVDLIVLDMVMPKGINGRKTYEEIIKIRPGQKAIIASGYAKTKEVDLAQELGAGKYIKKPYTLAKVGITVKEELEK